MHILIALVTALGGLLWGLYRLQSSGVDLNAFNPFYWVRRRRWAKEVGTKPLHRVVDPMEAAAVLIVAMAELRGTVTQEVKSKVTSIFSSEFNISQKDAAELYASSSYLLRDAVDVPAEVKNILSPSVAKYEQRHKQSLMAMLREVGGLEGNLIDNQQRLVDNVEVLLDQQGTSQKAW